MNPELRDRLLASIERDEIAVLWGAGISMVEPSQVPHARKLAELCFDKADRITPPPGLDSDLREDLEALADYFHERGDLLAEFIRRLVPWNRFVRYPNSGHQALADFLICRLIDVGVTTNLDVLVERAGEDLGLPIQGALTVAEAAGHQEHAPLAKIHGCYDRGKEKTLWSKCQLEEEPFLGSIPEWKDWLAQRLVEKDLIITGFWSDWSYLSEALQESMSDVEPRLVLVVDPSESEELEEKAPDLWALMNDGGVDFQHIQDSGVDFLDELRREYSRQFLERVALEGEPSFHVLSGLPLPGAPTIPDGLETDVLYELRRDFCGVPFGEPIREKRPHPAHESVGGTHLLLLANGATLEDGWYVLGERRIRILRGAGSPMSSVRRRHEGALGPQPSDLVICAGASSDGGAASDIVRGNDKHRPLKATSDTMWLTENEAVEELGLG